MNTELPFNPIELAQKYGTPLYVYHIEKIIDQYNTLKKAFQYPKLKISYACKALSNINILKVLQQLGGGLDAVSIEEIYLGLKAGFLPEHILFTPNMVLFEEVEEAIDLGVKINVDNLELLEFIAHKYPKQPVCIRINPHITAGGNKNISVGHIDSKFGISIHQMPLVERIVKTWNMNIEGVHMHTGSDILESDVFLFGAEILLNIAEKFKDSLQYVDFGSGFKVAYKPNDIKTDVFDLGPKLVEKIKAFNEKIGKEVSLVFEPGKFLVSEAGYFLVTASTIKQTTSTVFVGVNSGFNHLIRPMFYDSYHQIENVSNPQGRQKIYSVVGYICETDTFAWNRPLAEVRTGDILLFKNAGAYCFSMASNYNSRRKPAEVMIYKGKDHLIRERETMDDIVFKQKEVDLSL